METLRRLCSKESLLAIVGMSVMWTCVHNQLMYPVTFIFVKEDAPNAMMLFLAFAILELATCAAVFATRKRALDTVLNSAVAMGVVGALGAAGTVLLVFGNFSTTLSTVLVAVGVSLVSVYVPVLFAFWATRLSFLGDGSHGDGHIVALATIASYILFCLFTAARIALEIHASTAGMVYPIISAVLAVVSIKTSSGKPALQGTFSVKQLPLNPIIPSLAFVYLCSVIISVLNPPSSLSEYPPRREVLYLLDAVLFIIVAVIYLKSPKALKRCSMQTFAILSIYLVGAVLLTALGTLDTLNVGNFPAIAGKNAFDLFILMLILVTAHNKHINPLGPICVYFAADLWLSHFFTALVTHQGSLAAITAENSILVFAFIVIAAFLVSATVNVVLIFFVARTPKAQVNEKPDEPHNAAEDRMFEQVQAAWGLSKREVDIVRLVCKNAQTAKIADTLCIAESTVYTHLKRIYRKAGVHSKYELIDLVETFVK